MAITTGVETSICSAFAATAKRHADQPALGTQDGEDRSWRQYADEVRQTAAGLHGLGLRRGDTIACWLRNRPESHVADAAALHVGATPFSVLPAYRLEQVEAVLADADAEILITEARFVEPAIALRAGGATRLDHIVSLDGGAPQVLGWDEMLDAARPDFDFERGWRAVEPGDLATRIYSGPAGGPLRRVGLTHRAVVTELAGLRERLGVPKGAHTLSFLPMAYVEERLIGHYLPILGGGRVTCCRELESATEAIAAIHPELLLAPPRTWERLGCAIDDGLGGQRATEPAEALARVGLDRLQVALAGPAPCPPELIAFWRARGIPLATLDLDRTGADDLRDGLESDSLRERRSG